METELKRLKGLIDRSKMRVVCKNGIYIVNHGAIVGFSKSLWKHLSDSEKKKFTVSPWVKHGETVYR